MNTQKETYTLAELRSALRKAGAKIRTMRYSEFIGTKITDSEGNELQGAIFRSSEDVKAWRKKNAAALEVMEKFKGKTYDGMMRVII